jgi:hypothetical protein
MVQSKNALEKAVDMAQVMERQLVRAIKDRRHVPGLLE